MGKANVSLLTVMYHETQEHVNLADSSVLNFDPNIESLVVINKEFNTEFKNKFSRFIYNDENCLAKAWNIGLKELFKINDYVVVTGLDQSLYKDTIPNLIDFANKYPEAGIWSATNSTWDNKEKKRNITHGDGSFSFFIIHKKTFENVGDFDENFIPAYFEDNDYLERAWLKGYKPLQSSESVYFHITQGTVKYGNEIKKQYPIFMQKNLEYFIQKWGKIPDHLPKNIKFS